jgi:hypothetical protein
MKTLVLRAVLVTVSPTGSYISLPAQVGTACPLDMAVDTSPMEHPQDMTFCADSNYPVLEPSNNSSLASGFPHASLLVPVA